MKSLTVQSTIDVRETVDRHWDVAVIGAGPGGAVAAKRLAQRGVSVLLIERSTMPRPKVCGGCLAPAGARALQDAGLGTALRDAVELTRCTVHSGEAAARLPAPGYLAIGRDVLDARLTALAAAGGARVLLGFSARVDVDGGLRLTPASAEVRELPAGGEYLVRARSVIVADGLSGASLAGRCEFDWRVRPGSRMGAGTMLLSAPIDVEAGEIAMLCDAAGYVGMVRLSSGHVDLAAALDVDAARIAGGPAALCDQIIRRCGGDASVLAGAGWRGTPLLTRHRRCIESGIVKVLGDAAGYVEPFTGEGMTWAIRGALSLSEIVADELQRGSFSPGEWSRAHAALTAASHRRCGVVARLVRCRGVMHAAVRVGERWPAAALLALTLLGPSAPSRVPA